MQDVAGGVGIIFYAGHGMQFEGNNYVIPTSAKLELSSDLDDQCLKMNAVMSVLNTTNKSLNILFLDACRSIPSFSRDSEQGWTKVNAPRGSIIVFATEAGKVASDGNGKNGLFTSKLLTRINEPGLNITDVLKRVKQDVFIASEEKQLPSLEDNSIGGDFFFTPGSETKAIVTIKPEVFNNPKTDVKKEQAKSTGIAEDMDNRIYDAVETNAEFPGGMTAIGEILKNNLVYPLSAKRMGMEGKVHVGFVVNTDGNITDITIVTGTNEVFYKEALRVVSLMQPWIPAKNKGRSVRTKNILPINFRLK
jgi:TonB family protein